jgi:chemotaxis protein CheZ
MLGADSFEGESELLDELKERARGLVSSLELGDFTNAAELIRQINESRDRSIYREVGKLTRGLHDAIVNFQIDAAQSSADQEKMSKIANAQERLDYVIDLTQRSADKTMDMVEEGIPVAEQLGVDAKLLHEDWQRLIRREMNPEQFRDLYHRIDVFLGDTVARSGVISEKFNSILLAQDRLVDLMRVAGQVEQIAGIFRAPDMVESAKVADVVAEGPQIKANERTDVVSGQDDVDDLLSSLGF